MGCTSSAPIKTELLGKQQGTAMTALAPRRNLSQTIVRISDFYDWGEVLGEGSFGSVVEASQRATGTRCAVKVIPKRRGAAAEVAEEAEVMRLLAEQGPHPNIVRFFETFEDRQNTYLVMETCSGGDLIDKISETSDDVVAGHFTEAQAAHVMAQLLDAVSYMHRNHVVHGDLKPEHFLLSSEGPVEGRLLKVIDFGLSRRFEPVECFSEGDGLPPYGRSSRLPLKPRPGMPCTPYYVAPEVLVGAYGPPSDLWSCGVILCNMLTGEQPFVGVSNEEVLDRVREADFSFQGNAWKGISPAAKSLVSSLLDADPGARLTAEQAMSHHWLLRPPTDLHMASATTTEIARPHAVAHLSIPLVGGVPSSRDSPVGEQGVPHVVDFLTWNLQKIIGGVIGKCYQPTFAEQLEIASTAASEEDELVVPGL